MNQIQAFLFTAACLVSMTASAQWQWLDKDGHKVFSDRAPPPEVLEKDILKRPPARSAASAPVPMPQAEASAPRLSGIDKDLLEKKKKAEEAETAKRKAEQERIQKAKAENCTRAKQARLSFDSAQRIARTNEKGEREIMDAASRAAEVKRIDSIIASDCN
jgi:hypothetical protein